MPPPRPARVTQPPPKPRPPTASERAAVRAANAPVRVVVLAFGRERPEDLIAAVAEFCPPRSQVRAAAHN